MAAIEPLGIDPLDLALPDLDSRTRPATTDWMHRAACKGKTHLFFPPRAERPQARVRREAQARHLCNQCPVADSCRSFARQHREYGYWGAESEEERHLAGFTVAAPIGVRARSGSRTVVHLDVRRVSTA